MNPRTEPGTWKHRDPVLVRMDPDWKDENPGHHGLRTEAEKAVKEIHEHLQQAYFLTRELEAWFYKVHGAGLPRKTHFNEIRKLERWLFKRIAWFDFRFTRFIHRTPKP